MAVDDQLLKAEGFGEVLGTEKQVGGSCPLPPSPELVTPYKEHSSIATFVSLLFVSHVFRLPLEGEFRFLLATSAAQVLFKGLRAKMGVSFGIPSMRSPSRTSGRASYFGTVVQMAARFMMVACPGQVLLRDSPPICNGDPLGT